MAITPRMSRLGEDEGGNQGVREAGRVVKWRVGLVRFGLDGLKEGMEGRRDEKEGKEKRRKKNTRAQAQCRFSVLERARSGNGMSESDEKQRVGVRE